MKFMKEVREKSNSFLTVVPQGWGVETLPRLQNKENHGFN